MGVILEEDGNVDVQDRFVRRDLRKEKEAPNIASLSREEDVELSLIILIYFEKRSSPFST